MKVYYGKRKSFKDSAKALVSIGTVLVLSFLVCLNSINFPAFATTTSGSEKTITVVMDNNYPPYSYINDDGIHVGIVVDQWALFEKKTGIHVKLLPMQWSEAFNGMKEGKYDVIDTISFNKDRTAFLDYANPYATIEVPIFYSSQITGITDAKTLKGFTVAAKRGDLAIRKLQEQGITNIVEYPSAEELVKAASEKKVVVFVLGKPPAEYFLHKFNAQDLFKYSSTLYTSQFFRAVQKGNTELQMAINKGFESIDQAEYDAINKKYMGYSLSEQNTWTKPVAVVVVILLGVGVVLILWRWSLGRMTRSRMVGLQSELLKLKEKVQRQQLFFDAIPDLFFIFSMEGYIIDYQGASKGDLYRSPEAFLNKHVKEVYPPQLAEDFLRVIESLKAGDHCKTIQYWMTIQDEPTYFEARIVLEQDLLVVIVRNIDAQHKLQLESENYLKSLEKKSSELERFIQVLVHDLHSPIIGIKAYSDMVLKDLNEDKPQDILRDTKKIMASAMKADHILSDLIEYLRINSAVCHRRLISMKHISQEIYDQLEPVARGNDIDIRISETLPSAYGDPDLVQIVLRELVMNAIQHMGNIESKWVEIGYKLTEKETVFYVKDNGIGILKNDQKDVFGLFAKSSPETEGLGIGLATLKLIIEKHKGKIWIESTIGNGTEICFTLPDSKE